MGIIVGLIVGSVLTYLLTSSKDLNAYRRERLEKLASTLRNGIRPSIQPTEGL